MSKFRYIAVLAGALALCIALAGCGGGASSSSAVSSGGDSSASAASSSASSSSSASESSSAASSSSASSSAAASDYTAGNGTLDCEFCTIEVTGQGEVDGGATLEVTIANKTDDTLHVVPAPDGWEVNGQQGVQGSNFLNPEAGETVESYLYFLDPSDFKRYPSGQIAEAAGEILIEDDDYQVLGRYDFSYTA